MPSKDKGRLQAYREAHRKKHKAYMKAYWETNRERLSEKKRAYHAANREHLAERVAAYREANKEQIREQRRAYREANKELIKERKRADHKRNRERHNARSRAYHKAHPEKVKSSALKRKFGITLVQYNFRLDAQGFVCAICGTPELENGRHLAVDHCHKTGQLRGLLCGSCNRGLGYFIDNPEYLERATRYLYYHEKAHKGETT